MAKMQRASLFAPMLLAVCGMAAAFIPPTPTALAPGLHARAVRLRVCSSNLAVARQVSVHVTCAPANRPDGREVRRRARASPSVRV